MTQTRFQKTSLYLQQGAVTAYKGLDPLTGLPVLIYTFPEKPLLNLNHLQSENIPGILSSSYDGQEGVLVVAHSDKYQPLAQLSPETALPLMSGSARALKDATEAGVIHGDIRPERFLVADTHLLLEGFGVPWRAEDDSYRAPEIVQGGSFEGDVYSWAKSLRALGGQTLPGEVNALLEACLAPEPHLRPVAKDVYESLVAMAERSRPLDFTTPSANKATTDVADDSKAEADVFDSLELDFDFDAALAEQPFEKAAVGEAAAYMSDTYDTYEADAPFVMDADIMASDPGLYHSEVDAAVTLDDTEPDRLIGADRQRQEGQAGSFVKDLPPGATYRRGGDSELRVPSSIPEAIELEEERPKRNYRNIARLFAILSIAALAAVLLLLYQRRSQDTTDVQTGGERARYRVAISVEPADVPPVEVIVVESPPGSDYRPGNILGRRTTVILDQSGTWQLQGRFQNRVSAPVTFTVPGVDAVTLTIPDPVVPSD